jgi:hypothetical protein
VRRPAPPPPAGPTVAAIEVVTGEVRLWLPGGEGPVPVPAGALGRPLPAGSEVETGGGDGGGEAGRLALRTAGGASLRLDAGTRLRLASAGTVDLDRGAVYVDSGAGPGDRGRVAVATAAGVFHELGTQFEVRVGGAGAATRLRVREGRVALERGAESVVTGAGEELTVHGDGRLDRGRVAVSGPDWEWVVAAAPMLDIEGVTVRAFLDWIARETGFRVEFADPAAAALADSVVLHGSIAHLTLDEALDTALASAGLDHRTAGEILVVSAKPD